MPNSGTLSYNGVTWQSMYKCKVDCKPIKDSANRAVIAHEYTLDVEGIIAAAPGQTTDAAMTNFRQALQAPAGTLQLVSKGFGTLQVNMPGGQLRDAAYGPWPEVFSWRPIGNDQAAEISWRCVTQVPCESNPAAKGILEYCFEESWDVDSDGYTKRSITGHLVIEATRSDVNSRAIPDNADAYREQIVPALLNGFRRTQQYKLSEDKRRLDFTFQDEELAEALPSGLSKAEVRHKVLFRYEQKTVPMRGTISGTVTCPAGQPKAFLWGKIMLLCSSRAIPGANGLKSTTGQPIRYWVTSFEIDDEMFDRSASFSMTYLIMQAFRPDFLKASQLWQQVPGTAWDIWTASMRQAFSARGVAGLAFANSDDLIVDLCLRQPPPQTKGLYGTTPSTKVGSDSTPFPNYVLDPATSWLAYDLKVRLLEDDRIAVHKPLQQRSPPQPVPPLDGFLGSAETTAVGAGPVRQVGNSAGVAGLASGGSAVGVPGAGVTSSTLDLVQRVSAPNYTFILQGMGVRVGFPVPIPRVLSVGGIAVTQAWQDVSQDVLCMASGVPIYRSTWTSAYVLPASPQGGLPLPETPIAG